MQNKYDIIGSSFCQPIECIQYIFSLNGKYIYTQSIYKHKNKTSFDLLSLGGFDPPPLTFCWLARFHYAKMTFTSFSGFDPLPPPLSARIHYASTTCFFLCTTQQQLYEIRAPPSHISVIVFTMSISYTELKFNIL